MIERDIKLISQLNKDWSPGKVKTKRAGGQTNRNYIVQYKNKKFFVRLPWRRTDIVDRKTEADNISALAKCKKLRNILPEYYLYTLKGKNIFPPREVLNLPDGTMVMKYIEGKDIDGKDLEDPKIQQALLKSLYTFHASGVSFVNVYDVFRDEVSKYKRKAKKYPVDRLIKKEKIKNIEEMEKQAKEKLSLSGKLSTHNDLIFENLRLGKDGRIYILDFEYAGFNIRDGLYYDLGIILGGNLFCKNPIKFKTFKKILKKAKQLYKKDLDDYKIYWGALANVLVMFWWGLVRYFSAETKKEKRYFEDYVLKRARGAERLFRLLKIKGVRAT